MITERRTCELDQEILAKLKMINDGDDSDDVINLFNDEKSIDQILSSLKTLFIVSKRPEAAYALACLYAGTFTSAQNLEPFLNVSHEDREALAIAYAKKAIEGKFNQARCFLIQAFMTGEHGCIKKNQDALFALYEELVGQRNQNTLFELGCFFLGFYPNGTKIEIWPSHYVVIPLDTSKGLMFLLETMKGENMTLALNTFDMICKFYFTKFSEEKVSAHLFAYFKSQAVRKDQPFLHLLFAYLYCPEVIKDKMDFKIPLPAFSLIIMRNQEQSLDKTIKILDDLISNDHHSRYASLAVRFKQFLAQLANEDVSNSTPKFCR